MPSFYSGKKVLVCGGAGFIGSHTVDSLLEKGAVVSITTTDKSSKKLFLNLGENAKKIRVIEADLRSFDACRESVKGNEVVINLASAIGNIEYSKAHADIFRNNVVIELNLLEAARLFDIERYLVISSASVYPSDAAVPIKEEEALRGLPGESKFGYGMSKRTNEAAAMAFARQYGLKSAIIRPSNVYGPRDNFFSERGLVIPSFVNKVFSGERLVIAGNGSQTRNFVYVKDCVEGMLLCLEKHAISDPVNIASNEEISIKYLAEKIISISGCETTIAFDKSLSSGSQRSILDTSKAKKLLGFEAKTLLESGLKQAIEWYRENMVHSQ